MDEDRGQDRDRRPDDESRFVATADHDGARLDRFLAAMLPGASRSVIQKHIEAGAVTVGGQPPAKGTRTLVRPGDEITYVPPPPEPVDLVAEDIPVSILYEDDDLVVVDKPKNLVVHPAAGHPRGTLVNALLHHIRELQRSDHDCRPGIVHRLDRDTTGAMVVAKNAITQRALVDSFRRKLVDKVYLAVVKGVPREATATIDTLYGRHPRDRKRFSCRVDTGKQAVSHYRTLERFPGAAYLEVRIETGRTHQIRVHLMDRGHPLVGDQTYGQRRRSADPRVGPILSRFDRPALHARRLTFEHPGRGERMTFEAPLPPDLVGLLEQLRAAAKAPSPGGASR